MYVGILTLCVACAAGSALSEESDVPVPYGNNKYINNALVISRLISLPTHNHFFYDLVHVCV